MEVCKALVLHELGGTCDQPSNYDLEEVMPLSNKCTPILFLLPDYPITQPTSTQGEHIIPVTIH